MIKEQTGTSYTSGVAILNSDGKEILCFNAGDEMFPIETIYTQTGWIMFKNEKGNTVAVIPPTFIIRYL